jgi:hypothetical protein
MPIRDQRTGNVVDGYRYTVVSNETGTRAVIDVPRGVDVVAFLREHASAELARQDAALAAFAKPQG